MAAATDGGVYDSLNLYSTPERYIIEPTNSSDRSLVIDRVSREISLSAKPDIPPHAIRRTIYGIVGIIHLLAGPYLIVIVERRRVGEINGQVVWRIKATEAYSFTRTSLHLTENQNQYNKQYTAMVQTVLSTPNFYYSTTYDLSHTLQKLYNTTPDFLQMGLMERADQRFVWNHHLMSELSNQVELRKFCLPIIHGFVYIKACAINGHGFTFALISRRSCYRAGTRMFMRGLDSEGHAANFVETEQIIEGDTARSSFVQTRGSIPLFWTQLPNLRYKPPPTLTSGLNHLEAFQKHFDNQIYTYGNQVIINLIDQKGPEKTLGRQLQEVVNLANNPKIRYEAFDFHHECKRMQWDRLSILMDRIAQDQDAFGYFMMLYDSSVPCLQTGVFRTNCIDCLDRTNVVQSLLARRSLEQQLLRMGILVPGETIKQHSSFEALYKNVWADNGDFCSIQYAGTGALKTDFTRTGKRTVFGAMRDGYNSAVRYIKNNFNDGFRQDAIDLFLGNYRVQEGEGAAVSCPLRVRRENKYWLLPCLLMVALGCCLYCLCFLGVYSKEYFLYFLFWMAMTILTLMAIVYYGTEFVDFPKLRDLTPSRRWTFPHLSSPKEDRTWEI
ncbi:phosphatidylinositol-3-phosphatase SAC1-like isoform X2 [Dermacentor silvarum]|uniref:phosphatidylinositol-3-phosphatase SAC1-like isoform X2 n=1 Tax=Dermacentor silvarum TaxID=543639 RepID=UPI00189C1119|nr:phosphatidylinositol-3-phosphatase SAC1-like isoform X2 [Dermacentor silvarum]